MIGARTRIRHNHFPRLQAEARPKAALVVRQTTAEVAAGAAAATQRTLTGAMRSSWETRFPSPLTGVVANTARNQSGHAYAFYHEFGTSKMSAMPMVRPTVERSRAPFIEAMRQVIRL